MKWGQNRRTDYGYGQASRFKDGKYRIRPQSLDIHDPSDHYNQGRSSIVYIIICSAWTSVHNMQQ
jgi:hypothetical protein